MYGKWEDFENGLLPELDACGAHFGYTPESPDVEVYHHHVQDSPPFTFGCYGPNDDNTLVTVEQCLSAAEPLAERITARLATEVSARNLRAIAP